MSESHIDDRWADIRRELGLDENMKLHCLRHSYMTHLLEAGYPGKFVQLQAGHIHMGSMATYTNKIGDEFCNAVLRNAHAAAASHHHNGCHAQVRDGKGVLTRRPCNRSRERVEEGPDHLKVEELGNISALDALQMRFDVGIAHIDGWVAMLPD